MSEQKARRLSQCGCLLFCITLVLCSFVCLFSVGFTQLTEQGQKLVFPTVNLSKSLIRILFWILAALEYFRDRRRSILCLVLCFLYSSVNLPGRNIWLVEFALLVGTSNLASKKVAGYTWLGTHFIYLVAIMIMLSSGLVQDVLMPNNKTILPVEMGHSFGMGHANSLALLLLSSALGWWLMHPARKWWITLLFFEVLAGITLMMTLSRTSALLLAVFPFFEIIVARLEKLSARHSKGLRVVFGVLPWLVPLITFGIYFLFREQSTVGGHLSNFFIRFQETRVFKNYGFSLFGIKNLNGPYFYLDNAFLWLLVYCGIIPSILTIILYSLFQVHLVKKNQYRFLAVSVIYLAYSFMENAMVYSVFYLLPLIAFAPLKVEPLTLTVSHRIEKENVFLKSWKGKLVAFTVCFAIIAGGFYWIVRDDWSRTGIGTEMVSASGLILPESEEELLISQTVSCDMERVKELKFQPGKIRPEIKGEIELRLLNGEQVLWTRTLNSEELRIDEINTISLEPELTWTRGKELRLEIDAGGTGVSFQKGNTIAAGKYEIEAQTMGELKVNGVVESGALVLGVQGENLLTAYRWILPGALVLYLICLGLFVLVWHQKKTGEVNFVGKAVDLAQRYSYLLKTLVSRDFRIKYQSSILGVLWSFLNPLLTMVVYLFVFSMIFRSNIENFPVYLLTGIVMFNYFSESTNQGLLSIVGNRTLITKVYMPKYIYPLAKVLSSAVNLVISFVPLFLVIIVTGLPIHKSILLLPLVLLFQIMFCTGMSLFLSALNVFFRDIQFLWGILLTIWNFLTPIFYPESIIPQSFIKLYHLNPLYQIIYFMRSIILNGVSPSPMTYLYCFLSCGIPLIAGILFFKKNQDRFVLYL